MLIMQFPAHCCILYLCICLYVFVFIYLYLCICICVFLFAILIRLTQLNANHAIPCSERLLWKMCKRVGCERLEKGGHLRKIGGNTWSYTHLRWDEDNRLEKHIFSSKSLLSLPLRLGFQVNQFPRKNMIWFEHLWGNLIWMKVGRGWKTAQHVCSHAHPVMMSANKNSVES